jgi:hypothetical protein
VLVARGDRPHVGRAACPFLPQRADAPLQSGASCPRPSAACPVTASKPWITPEGAQRSCPSSTWCPVTTTPRTMVGGELIETYPGGDLAHARSWCRPGRCCRSPAWPAGAASTANSRASSVPSMIRVAQAGPPRHSASRNSSRRGTPRYREWRCPGPWDHSASAACRVAGSSAITMFLGVHTYRLSPTFNGVFSAPYLRIAARRKVAGVDRPRALSLPTLAG